ncbi:acyltransferase family protein [Kocuria tytonis]|uniref:acyltransferase family protein n=1 Tax=Kocuria tytonis TaxID=2054280 RepID=UPI001F1BDF75|nr:acyltransferase family protein [Kocuria tytonis]
MAPAADRVARFSGFRPEVQGLRAVAVLLVVLYHVFMGRVPGGVDIFLFISSFFMTMSFVRKIEGGRPLGLGRYWLHTFKRLLPLAAVVVLATFLLVWRFYPVQDVADFRSQGIASILYAENWALAFNAVDYYAADHSSASPFQHFWSLSVQGQVFLVWPLVFTLAWLVKRRTGRSSLPVLAACFGTVFAVSLTFSVITTHTQQAFAYFDTRARLWEFALGSLVALAIPYLRLPRALRVVLGWGGFVSMVSVGILVDVQGAFPGWIALWPLLSAAAIIVAGQSGSRWGFDRFLSWAPVVRMGDAAYALYLVHWPLLITYLVIRERPVAGPRSGVLIVVVSVLLALVLTRLVETPLKRWAWPEARTWRLALVIAVCMGTVLATAGVWTAVERHREAQLEARAELDNPGARVLEPGYEFTGNPDAPTLPATMSDQWVGLPDACRGEYKSKNSTVQGFCRQSEEVENPTKVVAVVGNSHMEQYMGAVIPVAEEENWQLVSVLQPGCGLGVEGQSETCRKGNRAVMEYLQDLDPDAVLTTSTRAERMAGDAEHVVNGLEDITRQLSDDGVTVVGFRDNPRLDFDPTRCVAEKGREDPSCTVSRDAVLKEENPAAALDGIQGFVGLDPTPLICPQGRCAPVIGNVSVWLDSHHLTADYARSMAPLLRDRLVRAVESGT